jgi:ribonuclease-3
MKYQELFSYIPTIESKIGYMFSDRSLLVRAFVHRSFLNENRDIPCQDNERFEFLGDSVLNLIVAEYLFQKLPDVSEGKLSSLRAHAVSSLACTCYFEVLNLYDYMLVGRGEELQAGRGGRSSIVADMFEALLGAIYLDGGLDSARIFFLGHFTETLNGMCLSPEQNWKALLQEYTQKNLQKMPLYRLINETGPDHERYFEIGVFLDDECIGKGMGTTKKEAERQAAKVALEHLGS